MDFFEIAKQIVRDDVALREAERETSKDLRRFLLQTPGVEAAMKRSVVDLDEEETYDDEELEARRLTDLGYFP